MPDVVDLRIQVPRVFQPLLQPSRYKGAWGGRGSAKSHRFAEQLIADHVRFPELRSVCAREFQNSLDDSVKQLLEDKIKKFNLGHLFIIRNTHIETPGDGVIIFRGLADQTAESIKSLEGFGRLWVEEAQTLSERSLELIRPTIREHGSEKLRELGVPVELWFTWNPENEDDPVDVLLRSENTPPEAIVVRSNYADNPFFPEALRAEMEWDRGRDPDKYAHVWLGAYNRKSEARVFRNYKIEAFETPADAILLYGADWGFSIDPSVLVRCFVQGRKLFVDRAISEVGVEIDDLPAFFDTLDDGEARKWECRADSARPETISYLKKHGYPRICAATKGPNSVKEGVIFLQNYDIIVHPRAQPVVDEFALYCFKTDKRTKKVTNLLEDKKNHTIDSLRYAVEKLRGNGMVKPKFIVW